MSMLSGTKKLLTKCNTLIKAYDLIQNAQTLDTCSGLSEMSYRLIHNLDPDLPLTEDQRREIELNNLKYDIYDTILLKISELDVDNL